MQSKWEKTHWYRYTLCEHQAKPTDMADDILEDGSTSPHHKERGSSYFRRHTTHPPPTDTDSMDPDDRRWDTCADDIRAFCRRSLYMADNCRHSTCACTDARHSRAGQHTWHHTGTPCSTGSRALACRSDISSAPFHDTEVHRTPSHTHFHSTYTTPTE